MKTNKQPDAVVSVETVNTSEFSQPTGILRDLHQCVQIHAALLRASPSGAVLASAVRNIDAWLLLLELVDRKRLPDGWRERVLSLQRECKKYLTKYENNSSYGRVDPIIMQESGKALGKARNVLLEVGEELTRTMRAARLGV